MELGSERDAPRVLPRRTSPVESLDLYERRGDGHTVSRHCGTSPAVEADRLARHPMLPATGSFPDVATAQRSVEACVAARHIEVARWRRGGRSRLVIDHDMGEVSGNVLQRARWAAGDTAPVPATSVRIVLRRNRRYPAGYAVLTAYPVLRAPANHSRRS
jgi:hypothetical protein